MTDLNHRQSDDWSECQPGEIGGLVAQLKQRRRLKTVRNAAGVLAGVMLLLFVGNQAIESQRKAAFLADCKHCKELSERYLAGTIVPAEKSFVDRHLGECSHCREFYAELKQAEESQAVLELPDGERLAVIDASHAVALR